MPPRPSSLPNILRRHYPKQQRLVHLKQTGVCTNSSKQQPDDKSILYQLRHSRTLIRESWRCAIDRTNSRTVIDATAGRGSDTIVLGQLVGSEGAVYAMDIQPAAVEETQDRFEKEKQNVIQLGNGEDGMGELYLRCASHESFAGLELPARSVACIVYNLGWYPGTGADRSIVTVPECTVASLESAVELLAVDGIITIAAYVGHEGGDAEADAVVSWAGALNKKEWNVINVTYPNRGTAPSMIICERLR